jgi:beta-lactamase regulating signal transducer with metallopeptidase domain
MMLPASLQGIAGLAFERMLYSLAAGSALTAVVALVLRLTPRKNSQTRFAVWFATLLAVVALPLFGSAWGSHAVNAGSPAALLTIPATWAFIVVSLWAALALAGVLRVGLGLWQVRRLRRSCLAIDPQLLSADLQDTLDEFRKTRPVAVLVSSRVDVPTALGFRRPAVVIPTWLADEMTAGELKYVVLHELAHLRRHDDWTNLIQKLVKAVFFFHPGVWWIERKLSLDREMACDDAVLLQTSAARVYAQCLARVAEKRLSRRHMTLAQAAVDRVHQLSLRVMNILAEAPGGDRTARLWKPAIPMVMAIAIACAFSASRTPELVGVIDASAPASYASSVVATPPQAVTASSSSGNGMQATVNAPRPATSGAVTRRQWPTASFVPARYTMPQLPPRKLKLTHRLRAVAAPTEISQMPARAIAASFSPSIERQPVADSMADELSGQVVFLVMARQQVTTAGPGTSVWQVRTLEVFWFVPENRPAKQIPGKI